MDWTIKGTYIHLQIQLPTQRSHVMHQDQRQHQVYCLELVVRWGLKGSEEHRLNQCVQQLCLII